MRRFKLKSVWWLVFVAAFTLSACGSDPVEEVLDEVDPPQINYIDNDEELELELEMEAAGEENDVTGEAENDEGMIGDSVTDLDGDGEGDGETEAGEAEEKGGPVMETAMLELYLVDKNGLVAPQSLNVPKEDNELQQAVSHLVQEGPVTEKLPNGFKAVLPPGTEILDTEVSADGTATIDFSRQFNDYHPDSELQILQSLTWTVTQLEDVNRLKLKVDGEDLDVMPQNGTPVGNGYTRGHGINLEISGQADISATKPVVLYFLSQTEGQDTYYVPVTRRVPESMNEYEAVVDELLKGPDMMTQLLTDIRKEAALVEEPELKNGTLTVNFNEALLGQLDGSAMSPDVLNMLVLSLTEQEGVEKVSVLVNDESDLLVSSGEMLTEPVSRPEAVNAGEY
jgi:germination protein M